MKYFVTILVLILVFGAGYFWYNASNSNQRDDQEDGQMMEDDSIMVDDNLEEKSDEEVMEEESDTEEGMEEDQENTQEEEAESTNIEEEAQSEETTGTIELPPVDETWLSFTTRNEEFSFKYPTKGRYAPEWEQTYINESDKYMNDGCYTPESPEEWSSKKLKINGLNICQTTTHEGAAGSIYRTDHLTIMNESGQHLVISFTKRYSNQDIPGAALFDVNTYQATLEQIASTFEMN